jgi:DNA-binding HxlR family transcriptional regulator
MTATPLDVDPRLRLRHGPAPDCSIDRALAAVSTRSALLLMREVFYGVGRFDELTARVGISEPVAAARLKEPYREPGQRTRYAYRLTDQGSELLPVLVALLRWGDRWTPAEGGGPIELTHEGCGEPVAAELRCAAGHVVAASDVHVAPTDAGIRRRARG